LATQRVRALRAYLGGRAPSKSARELTKGTQASMSRLSNRGRHNLNMAAFARRSRRGLYAKLAIVIVLALVVLGGFVLTVPVANTTAIPYQSLSAMYATIVSTSAGPYLVLVPTASPYETSSTYVATIMSQVTTTSRIWSISQTALTCNTYKFASAYLPSGSSVQLSWSASDTVDVYVFNSTEYMRYVLSGATTPNVAGENGASMSGTMNIILFGSDTYYLVMHDSHGLVSGICQTGGSMAVYSTSATATYAVPVPTYSTETTAYVTSSTSIETRTFTTTVTSVSTSTTYTTYTLTSTSTTMCESPFWRWLLGPRTCQ